MKNLTEQLDDLYEDYFLAIDIDKMDALWVDIQILEEIID